MMGEGGGDGEDAVLPEELLAVLPADPLEQLELARRISSLAMASRVSRLDSETAMLRLSLAEKENTVLKLQQRVSELQHSLNDTTARLSQAFDHQSKLMGEKNVLVSTVKKLNRDVAKLETFKRTLMQSLQEDDETSSHRDDNERTPGHSSTSLNLNNEVDSSITRLQSIDDESGALSVKSNETPRFSSREITDSSMQHNDMEGSPKRQQGTGSLSPYSTSASPRWNSYADTRISLPPSQSTSRQTTAPNSPPHSSSARTRVDGKDFFRQARNRLSYEQFSGFLANIKELNAHRQTREETLRKANEIFGPENRDLYASFDNLLNRHAPS